MNGCLQLKDAALSPVLCRYVLLDLFSSFLRQTTKKKKKENESNLYEIDARDKDTVQMPLDLEHLSLLILIATADNLDLVRVRRGVKTTKKNNEDSSKFTLSPRTIFHF